ncbi:helix-turn-helix domain-containing protein [Luteibacter sp. CQ10]|uniref:helix-turn-helix domain-containing protein n=1 Tax=Luteibacter sp. CQ10 TaxID=2805821 RepID=UPI0034A13B28
MPWPSDYQERLLPLRLSEAIEAEWAFTASTEGTHVVLPDGRMDLILAFRSDDGGGLSRANVLIVGPARRWADVPVAIGDRFLGVRFRPGWGGPCLGVDPASLQDRALAGHEAEAVLGADGGAIHAARTPSALMTALSDIAHRRAASAHAPVATVRRALTVIQAAGGRLRLDEVARLVGVPERTLRRQLTLAVGLSFKAFSSVLRFQRAMRLLTDGPAPLDPADAAIESGYSDQAHMIREFRRHGGFTPGSRPALVLVGMSVE